MAVSVLVFGVTGYIGGAVLVGLLKAHPPSAHHKYTALVRSASSVPIIEALGVTVIQGSHSDLELIIDAASNADIVVNCADADNLELAKAILSGLEKRQSARPPILLHTSGTGVISDEPTGHLTEWAKKIWNDNDPNDIRSIPADQPHRNIDLEIFAAGERGKIATYIISPSTIYGIAHGNPVHKISQQVPGMIRTAISRKQTVYVGEGTNVWNSVHIEDLVDLYLLVLDQALNAPEAKSPYEQFYFGSVAEHEWGDIARRLAPLLHARGVVDSPEATSIPISEAPNMKFVANNSRSKSERGRKLGWSPHRKSIQESLEEDVDAVLA
jgi:nucleoside-diphosphate-sugar epimerase